jgi:two-component system, cell cycle response regulator
MRILIADDDPVSRRVLEATLSKLGHEVTSVADGTAALEVLLQPDGPRLAILDWMMPGTDGLGVCQEVRRRATAYVYIVVLTARGGRDDRIAAMEAEVDDFLTKPLDAFELRVRLRSGQRVLDLQERLLESQEALRYQATHDHLTGLWNRRGILEELAAELARATRESRPVAIAIGDLDHFKTINDTHGHATGDVVLQASATRLQSVLRSYDTVGRLGGEEFLLLLPGCEHAEAVEIAERARTAVGAAPIPTPDGPITIRMSLGVACRLAGEPADAGTLVEDADAALYRAKAGGRNLVSV